MNLYLVSRNALRFGASVYSESELDHRRPGLFITRKFARRETPFAVAAHQRKPCPANSNRKRAERESCAIDGSEAGYLSNQSLAKSRSAAMAECTVELARYCAARFEKETAEIDESEQVFSAFVMPVLKTVFNMFAGGTFGRQPFAE